MPRTYKVTSASNKVIERREWYSSDQKHRVLVGLSCQEAIANFSSKPDIPNSYKPDDGIDVLALEGFESFEYAWEDADDRVLILIDKLPSALESKIKNAWDNDKTFGLEELGWVEQDAESIMFFGPLLINDKPLKS